MIYLLSESSVFDEYSYFLDIRKNRLVCASDDTVTYFASQLTNIDINQVYDISHIPDCIPKYIQCSMNGTETFEYIINNSVVSKLIDELC